MTRALLLSASSYKDTSYLEHSKPWIKDFLGQNWDEEILFIPFAGVSRTNDEYEKRVSQCLENKHIKSIHRYKDFKDAIKNAKTIGVGGGNTFMLNYYLHKYDLIDVIKEAVENGALYFGWSAGANVAGRTIMTTNDMPIIMPKSFDSLKLFSHQINPHFISGKISNHNGESREQRLLEFVIANKQDIVYALPEGTALLIEGDEAKAIGYCDILKFEYNKEIATIKLGSKIKL